MNKLKLKKILRNIQAIVTRPRHFVLLGDKPIPKEAGENDIIIRIVLDKD